MNKVRKFENLVIKVVVLFALNTDKKHQITPILKKKIFCTHSNFADYKHQNKQENVQKQNSVQKNQKV